jgi:hypothetical protein
MAITHTSRATKFLRSLATFFWDGKQLLGIMALFYVFAIDKKVCLE